MTEFDAWIGRSQFAEDSLDLLRARAMQATVDEVERAPFAADEPLPPLWHWLYFWEVAHAGRLGYDGHPAKGEFLPPIPLPRRMWAGSRLTFLSPLPLGARSTRRSTIKSVALKEGRSGQLGFVTVAHRYAVADRICLEEEHDIVYRAAAAPGEQPRQGEPAPLEAPWRRTLEPTPVLLFRYSALTFNGHRIHYDRRFCAESEGYPGLVVHGPLLATLMVDLAARRGARPIARFAFRALAPVFDTAGFSVCAAPDEHGARLWIADADNRLCMQGELAWG